MNIKKLLLFVSAVLIGFASCSDSDEPYMTLESKTLTVEAEGGIISVDLASNVYYRVNNDCQSALSDTYWAVIDSYETKGDVTTYSFNVSANSSTDTRVGYVRFIGDDVTPLKLTISQKGMVPKGISPLEETVDAKTTSASIQVFGDKAWTATCTDADVTLAPISGVGDGVIKLSFPENKGVSARTIKVDVTLTDDATYTYTLVQEGFSGVLADWSLKELTSETSATFTDDEEQSVFPGTNGKYVLPTTGSGRIEYWAAERTGYAKGTAVCKRAVGGNGDPYVSGTIPGDYWYIYADKEGEVIPAGTTIRFYFVTKFGTMCSNYWMVEYKEGDAWAPALATQTVTESATTTLSGASIEYSATVTYNYAGMLLDTSNNGAYIPVEGSFTTKTDMNEIVIRFGESGRLALAGSKYAGKYIDWTHASGQSRMSAQHPNNTETGAAVKEYNEHVIIEIVK